jgi:hypothetical protein
MNDFGGRVNVAEAIHHGRSPWNEGGSAVNSFLRRRKNRPARLAINT